MEFKKIETMAEYGNALKEIDFLMDSKVDTRDGERLNALVTLVEGYEAKHFPVDIPDRIEATKLSDAAGIPKP